MSVIVVGSLNADLMVRTPRRPDGGETVLGSDLAWGPGGKSANQAIAAARLGAAVTMVGAVGDDVFGQRLRAAITDEGISSAVETIADVATGTAIIVVDDAGENSIVVSPGANALVDSTFVEKHAAFSAGDVVVACLEIPRDGVLAAARAARAAGATVILNLSPYAPPAELLSLTDVLLVNEHEVAQLVGNRSWSDTATALADLGVDRTIVTLGARGSVVLDAASGSTAIDPVAVDVVDTTGCGDAYTGAIAAALTRGLSLVEAARAANRFSADAARRPGASASYPDAESSMQLAWRTPAD